MIAKQVIQTYIYRLRPLTPVYGIYLISNKVEALDIFTVILLIEVRYFLY